jgi:hypothetical protein
VDSLASLLTRAAVLDLVTLLFLRVDQRDWASLQHDCFAKVSPLAMSAVHAQRGYQDNLNRGVCIEVMLAEPRGVCFPGRNWGDAPCGAAFLGETRIQPCADALSCVLVVSAR